MPLDDTSLPCCGRASFRLGQSCQLAFGVLTGEIVSGEQFNELPFSVARDVTDGYSAVHGSDHDRSGFRWHDGLIEDCPHTHPRSLRRRSSGFLVRFPVRSGSGRLRRRHGVPVSRDRQEPNPAARRRRDRASARRFRTKLLDVRRRRQTLRDKESLLTSEHLHVDVSHGKHRVVVGLNCLASVVVDRPFVDPVDAHCAFCSADDRVSVCPVSDQV